jgi:hypothetical protein
MMKGEPGVMQQSNLDSALDMGISAPPKKLNSSGAAMMGKALTRTTRRGGGGGRRLSYSPETDKQLLEWVVERSRNGLPVSREAIQTQALALVRDECPDFKASSGWVEKFLIRHKISLPTRASMLGKELYIYLAMHPFLVLENLWIIQALQLCSVIFKYR